MTFLPESLEPVILIIEIRGSLTNCWATSASPRTISSAPDGKICLASSTIFKVDEGVWGAGLITTVLPAAIAGPIFQIAMMKGKFQGAMEPITPTGFLTNKDV